jgi:hypothetical protein
MMSARQDQLNRIIGRTILLRAADRQMSLIVEALLDLSSYLRNEQILIDARKCDRQIILPILYDSAGPT